MEVAAAAIALLLLIGLAAAILHLETRPSPGRVMRPVLLAALFSVGLVGYFFAVDIFGGDAHAHTAETWLTADILANGELPIWTNEWYLGFPIGLYYGFFYYLLTAVCALALGVTPILATKLVLLVLHAASGLVVYRLGRLSGAGSYGALFGALFYTYSFQHVGLMMLAGALPLSVHLLVVPAIALVMERLIAVRPPSTVVPALQASLLGSVAVFAHFQYAAYSALALGLLGALRIGILIMRRDVNGALLLARFLLLTAVLAAGLAAWFLGPVLLERRYLLLGNDRLSDNLILERSLPAILHALTRFVHFSRDHDWLRFYLGSVAIAMTAAGIAAAVRAPRSVPAPHLAGALALLLTLPLALTSRFSGLWFLFAAQTAAWGVTTLVQRRSSIGVGSGRVSTGSLLIVAMLAECSLTLVHAQPSRLPTLHVTRNQARATGRFATITSSDEALWRSLDPMVTGRPALSGGVPQNATKSHAYVAALCSAIAVEVIDHRGVLSRTSHDGLRMLNVSTVHYPDLARTDEVDGATPAIFAPAVIDGSAASLPIEQDGWYDVTHKYAARTLDRTSVSRIVDTIALHADTPVAARLVMHPTLRSTDLRPASDAVVSDADASIDFSIIDLRETHTTVSLTYRASHEGAIQLAYAYYPFLRVSVDGAPSHSAPSALGLLMLPASAGEHRVEIEAGVSPLRHWLSAFSIAVLLGSVALAVRSARPRRTHP